MKFYPHSRPRRLSHQRSDFRRSRRPGQRDLCELQRPRLLAPDKKCEYFHDIGREGRVLRDVRARCRRRTSRECDEASEGVDEGGGQDVGGFESSENGVLAEEVQEGGLGPGLPRRRRSNQALGSRVGGRCGGRRGATGTRWWRIRSRVPKSLVRLRKGSARARGTLGGRSVSRCGEGGAEGERAFTGKMEGAKVISELTFRLGNFPRRLTI